MTSLWDHVAHRGAAIPGELHGRSSSVALAELTAGSTLNGALESLRGRSILIATREQLPTALALVELDGVARRIVLCTPDLTPEQLPHIARSAAADAIVVDAEAMMVPTTTPYSVTARPAPQKSERRSSELTEWVLLTSGTTGMPKLVLHSLESLAGTLPRQTPTGRHCVWSTFYDIRRYGGLQIYLRAVLSGAPLVLSHPGEPTRDFFTRAAAHGVTHISGTPTHWRRALMSGDAALLTPDYVRLSGEVADQAVLDALRAAYPNAQIAHAFASTEAGVAFDVNDGLAGFPADFLGEHGEIDLKVEDGTLRIRSHRIASRYLGDAPGGIAGSEGYVDTGDLVELEGGRYYFRGRRGGVINVGGLKVYPEEVESVLNADPRVRMSLVRARRNPITGAVVIAEVVLADGAPRLDANAAERLKTDLLNACRRALPAHKVPAALRVVAELETTAAGKLVRPGA